jgi:hypothetical protein
LRSTYGWTHAYVTVQSAGKLVVYGDQGAYGVTNPCGWVAGGYLELQDDGNMVLYDPGTQPRQVGEPLRLRLAIAARTHPRAMPALVLVAATRADLSGSRDRG